MARKGRARDEDRDEEFEPQEDQPRRRRFVAWPLLLVAFLAVLWWLPAIVARSPALGWFVARASADLKGSVEVGTVSLGWFSPVAAADVRVRDAAGQPVAELPKVTMDRRLWDLLLRPAELGQIKLDEPRLTVVLREGTSNVEQLLEKYLTAPSMPRSFALSLDVSGGRVEIVDAAANKSWQLNELALGATLPAAGQGPIDAHVASAVSCPGTSGRLTARCKLPEAGSPDLTVEIQSAPLDVLTPVVGRFLPGTILAGRATGNVRLAGNATHGTLVADGFQAEAPALADPVRLRQLKADWDVAWPGQEITVKQITAHCELGNLSLAGRFSPVDAAADKLLESLGRQSFEANGRLDLAALAGSLPKTLRIRPDTAINSGQLELAVSGRPDASGAAWQGRVQASALRATVERREIVWQQPLSINFSVRNAADGISVDALKCESSFLNLEAKGRPEELAAAARFDLGQLAAQLGQLVDLGELRTAGEGWAYLNWKSPDRKAFSAELEFQARNFRLALPDSVAWEEPNLVLFLSAAGQLDGGLPVRFDAAGLHAVAAPDQLDAKLRQPVADWRKADSWPIEARVQGRLEGWPARLRNWIDLSAWKAAGAYDLAARGSFSTSQVLLDDARLTTQELSLAGPGVTIVDPGAQLAAVGQWDLSQGQMKLRTVSLQSAAAAVEATDVSVDLPPQTFRLAGALRYQGDLERLRAWFPSAAGEPGYTIAGRLSGSGSMEQSAGTTRGTLGATIDNLLVADSFGQRFGEPQVRIALRGDYDNATGQFQLHECALASASLTLQAAGKVSGSAAPQTADVSGTAQYDLQRITELARPWLPNGIRLAGSGKDAFSIRGPLDLARVQAEASAGWTSGSLYGFQAGPGQLKARLADGVMRCEPIACTLSEGKMRLTPQIRLAPDPGEITVEGGLVADQIRVNPTMCHYALAYAVPALAGVATAEGRFSLQLERCRMPLADLGAGDVAGKLVIHSVAITPGPLVQQLAAALGHGSTANLSRESSIPFAMRDRRVHHEGMELVFPDVTVRTKGSVGLDRSLLLVASMPVPQKWIGQNPLGAALQNQIIEIPVSGTLEQPQLDRRGLEDFMRRFMGTATRNVLEDRLRQQLDRLLPK